MKDYFNYKDKVCVVTGSSNGMGLATTKMLVDLGASVYAVSRSATKVDGITASVLCDLSKKTILTMHSNSFLIILTASSASPVSPVPRQII